MTFPITPSQYSCVSNCFSLFLNWQFFSKSRLWSLTNEAEFSSSEQKGSVTWLRFCLSKALGLRQVSLFLQLRVLNVILFKQWQMLMLLLPFPYPPGPGCQTTPSLLLPRPNSTCVCSWARSIGEVIGGKWYCKVRTFDYLPQWSSRG